MAVMQANVVPHVHRLGSEFVNWYLVEDGDRLTAVDAGLPGFASELERDLHELGHRVDDVEALVLTHSDADHTGIAKVLREAGATVYIHGYDQATLASPGPKGGDARPVKLVRDLWRPTLLRTIVAMAGKGGARPTAIEGPELFADGDVLDVPGRPRVIHTPGHTPGHCAIVFEDRGALFAGDALVTWNVVTGSRGPQLMPRAMNVSNAEARESLDRLGRLEGVRVALPGHGEPWHGPATALVQRARGAA
jgi:glyoxylase-like metal-dependent hydrolase (beta-lactamase superfamily II)